MGDDIRLRLQRAAADSSQSPEDRAWAQSKYQEMFGRAPVEEGVPEMLKRPAMDPLDATLQRRKAQEQEPDEEPGMLSRLGSELKREVRGVGKGLLGSLLPIETTPEEQDTADRVENLGNVIPNAFTLGAYSGMTDMTGLTKPERRKELEEKNPGGTLYGNSVGAAASAVAGPSKMITEGAEAGVRSVAPELMTKLQGRIGVPAATGFAMGAADKAARGGDLEESLDAGGMGSAMGTAAATIPAAVQGARSSIQKASPWVGRYAKAKDAGMLDQAEALPPGRKGVVRASENARDSILARRDAKVGEAGGKYKAAEEAAGPAAADVGAVRAKLDKVRQGNLLSSGQPINKALDDEIASLESMLLDDAPTSDLLALRRSLSERANFQNKSPTDREMASRKLYEALRQGVRSSSSQLCEADDMFSAASKEAGQTDEFLGSKRPIKSVKQRRAAAAELEYMEDDSLPAMRRAPDLEALAAQDPEYAKALEQLMAKKSLEATRLTLKPGVRDSISPLLSKVPLIGASVPQVHQLGRAGGRMADQSLRSMQPAANMAPRLSLSLIDAILARRQQQEP